MLSSLQIENVAVIQKAEVHFKPGLNVLTGETGAGKSILLDSINAILGTVQPVRRGPGRCWTALRRRATSARMH